MTEPIDFPPPGQRQELSCDVAVVGGGTAGTMAAITAAEMGASVLLLDKAHVRHSGALAMGMDGVQQRRHPGQGHAGGLRRGDHPRQRRHHQPAHGVPDRLPRL